MRFLSMKPEQTLSNNIMHHHYHSSHNPGNGTLYQYSKPSYQKEILIRDSNTRKWHYTIYLIGLLIIATVYTSGCYYRKPSIERITQSEMQCEQIVQMAWGDGISDLGYASSNKSGMHAPIPLRFQIGTTGNIYVTDPLNKRILEFSAQGNFTRSFVVPTSKNEEFINDVAVGGNRVAVATTDHIYLFDQKGNFLQILKWPADAGNYALCSEDVAGRKVQVDEKGNTYACGVGGFERGGTIIKFDENGHSHTFYAGVFIHFVVGQNGLIYVAQSDNQILQLNPQGTQLGEITISEYDLANAGLSYPGLLVATDVEGNLYGDVVSAMKDSETVPFNALIQISKDGKILRIIERDKFIRPATNVVDEKGNLYIWRFSSDTSIPTEIWRCNY